MGENEGKAANEADGLKGPDAVNRPSGPDDTEKAKTKRRPFGFIGRFFASIQGIVVAVLSWAARLFDPEGPPRHRVIHQVLSHLRDRVKEMKVVHFGCFLVAIALLIGLGIGRVLDQRWTSPNIAVWLSPMGDTDPTYLPAANDPAKRQIGQAMAGLFHFHDGEKQPGDLNGRWRVVEIQFGCYRAPTAGQYMLKIRMPAIKRAEFTEIYGASAPNAPDLRREGARIVRRIRTHILEEYPLRGRCMASDGNDVWLNIGSLAGVRAYDEFHVLEPKWHWIGVKRRRAHLRVKYGSVETTRCKAEILDGAEKVHEKDPVVRTETSSPAFDGDNR